MNHRILKGLVTLCVLTLLAACGGADDPKSSKDNGGAQPDPDKPETDAVLISSATLLSADMGGNTGTLQVSASFDYAQIPVNTSSYYLYASAEDANGDVIADSDLLLVTPTQINQDFTLTIPAIEQNLVAKVYVYADESATQLLASSEYPFSLSFPRTETNLETVTDVSLSIVPGSYSSELQGNRRVHYFSAQVFDQLGLSVNGLERNPSAYFKAYEEGMADNESAVTVNSNANTLTVYLIIDVSSSITQAEASGAVLDAASKTAISLSDFASFKYYQFASDVTPLNDLSEIVFDTGNISGTALYYALDTALKDIELDAANNNDTVIITFTDGRDIASANYYDLTDTKFDSTYSYITSRLNSVKSAQATSESGSLITHFIGLGSDIDTEKLTQLATAGGGNFLAAPTQDDLQAIFSNLSNLIQSTYRLVYSSQLTSDTTTLELEVIINEALSDKKAVK